MTSSRGRRTRARASESRCRWPPDERGAALPQPGVEPVGQGGDEAVGLGRAQRRPDLLVGRRRRPRVTLPRTVSSKRNACCGTSATCRASSPGARSRRSTPSRRNRAVVGVDQPDQQAGQRALAGGGGADDGDGAPGRAREGHVRRSTGRSGVVARRPRSRPRRGRRAAAVTPGASRRAAVRRLAGRVEHGAHPPEADHAARELAEQPADATGSGRRRS